MALEASYDLAPSYTKGASQQTTAAACKKPKQKPHPWFANQNPKHYYYEIHTKPPLKNTLKFVYQ